MATERLIPVRRLRPDERLRAAAGRESVWIDGTWHTASRTGNRTACGRPLRTDRPPSRPTSRLAVCLTCEANDRRLEPTLGL